jgi:hypothetical protein
MSYRHTLEAALESVSEIKTLLRAFPQDGSIPEIEIDLTLQKLRNLYELMLMLKKTHDEKPIAEAIQQPAKVKAKEKTEILSDTFKGRETLHESFHQSFSNQETSFAGIKPVSDIYSAIGINDRFTFIRELFNNDTALFESTIKRINEAGNYKDAFNHLLQNFTWDMESEPVLQLLELLKRRYHAIPK